jgi:uncharacterized protein with beta-barrel porin domain
MQYTGELGQYFRHSVRRRMMASMQPSRDASSNSSARRRLLGYGLTFGAIAAEPFAGLAWVHLDPQASLKPVA